MPDQFILIERLERLAGRVDVTLGVVVRTLQEPTVLRQIGVVFVASAIAHEGRDGCRIRACLRLRCFNPRTREGCDSLA